MSVWAAPLVVAMLVLPPASEGRDTQKTLPSKLGQTFGAIRGHLLPAAGERRLPSSITATLTCRQYRDLRLTMEVTSTGVFEFRELDRGDYNIRIDATGYSVVQRSVMIENGTGQTVSVSITLGKRMAPAGPTPNSGPKTVSLRWLSVPEKAKRELAEAEKKNQNGEWEEAIRHLEKALEIHPQLPEAHTNMAALYSQLNQPQRALECLKQAVELDPDYVPALRNLGRLYLRERKYPEAAQYLERARQLEPGDYGTLYFSGEYHEARGDPLRSLAFYRKAFEINPDSYRMLRRISRIHSRMGIQERSLPLLQEFVRRNPEHRRASRVRGMIQQLTEDGSPPGSRDDGKSPPI